jgi:hypothetical protein
LLVWNNSFFMGSAPFLVIFPDNAGWWVCRKRWGFIPSRCQMLVAMTIFPRYRLLHIMVQPALETE